ncbi:hypothetical protein DNTS_007622 [Danionella cerebrum]|uniref:Protein-glutamine gamma-glutamyltransferase 2 n=1 Tax=Danionella cerebrum TaxID=2873325 RepID=A0A553MZL2_9TELE|nr:hypothetical protein DNTS_007622 [Danionella translucida]
MALDIGSVDLACEFNNTDHQTELNGTDRLIVRRGQDFTIKLHLNSGSFQPGNSQIHITAETGPHPEEQFGTRAEFGLSSEINNLQWSAAVISPISKILCLSICAAPDAPIGKYSLTLDDDAVYMDSEEMLSEYVLAQDGIIFRGDAEYPVPLAWNFGQFEEGILDACLKILDMNPKHRRNPGKDCSGRRNVIYVTRVLSAMINSNDQDSGVLEGCWKDTFEGGLSPMSWRGSVQILRSWMSTSCLPVRFGQCWVFAAVACTGFICVLNYHCWLESWMKRADLQPGYDGWQASDPTPQEKSEGVFCCGPVPVQAIKEGQLTFKYDAPFVFAEVNADLVYFLKYKDGSSRKVVYDQKVGQKISTKSVSRDQREDITHNYKYPEGSAEERQVFEKAKLQNKLLQSQGSSGLQVTIKLSSDVRKGCDFDVFAIVRNNSQVDKTCRVVFASRAVSYNGVIGQECGFKDLLNVELPPGAERKVPLRLNYSKYCNNLTEDNLIRLGALVIDIDTKEAIMAMRDIVLDDPEIKIRILGEPKENRKLAAELSLLNPLPEPLQSCCFTIEGANLTSGGSISQNLESCIEPGQEAKVKIYFTPNQSGLRKLLVDFNSDKLGHVRGYRNVIIGK